ncbi:hypothetical protein [Streptomyces sp. NPDC001774]
MEFGPHLLLETQRRIVVFSPSGVFAGMSAGTTSVWPSAPLRQWASMENTSRPSGLSSPNAAGSIRRGSVKSIAPKTLDITS